MAIDLSKLESGKAKVRSNDESARVYVTIMNPVKPVKDDFEAAKLWRTVIAEIGGVNGVKNAIIAAYKLKVGDGAKVANTEADEDSDLDAAEETE